MFSTFTASFTLTLHVTSTHIGCSSGLFQSQVWVSMHGTFSSIISIQSSSRFFLDSEKTHVSFRRVSAAYRWGRVASFIFILLLLSISPSGFIHQELQTTQVMQSSETKSMFVFMFPISLALISYDHDCTDCEWRRHHKMAAFISQLYLHLSLFSCVPHSDLPAAVTSEFHPCGSKKFDLNLVQLHFWKKQSRHAHLFFTVTGIDHLRSRSGVN